MIQWWFAGRSEKSSAWYIGAAAVGLGLIVWAVATGIYFLVIVVFIFAGVYILQENNAPDRFDVLIDEEGVRVGTQLYDFGSISDFSILYASGRPRLLRIRKKGKAGMPVDIPLTVDVNPTELRAYLLQFIPEDDTDKEMSRTDQMIDMLKL